ncbi:zinc ABC transporter substrate-binding protein [Fulvivirgaceae bacterium BMA12]|uniref:Zinc ABC transporter substrate-binding protein n=1 Tax=Agaribacillus aureus TaxID=3051825 RepID=A0ABT8L0X4_9BACT|nr:zinc ABC transporter substrate-binding protein [Fulvivirgaceae bacterium BMA12]
MIVNKAAIKSLASLLFLSILLMYASCSRTAGEMANSDGRMNIVTTTGMIEDIVKNIVQDSADVISLMGPGVDPHLYKATQGDLKRLKDASLIFYNGLHLEGKLGDIFKNLGKIKLVMAVSDDIPRERLINNTTMGGQYDPHIWFDVSLWKEAATYVSQSLIKNDSINGPYYAQNTATYLLKLDSLHAYVKQKITEIPQDQRIMVTAHDAFEYFGQAYNIRVEALQGISTMSEFGSRDVVDLVNFITEKKIKAVFVESSVPEKYIRSVVEGCRKKGHEVIIGGTLYSDAMGNKGTPAGSYIGMVRTNVNTIVNALK